MASHGPSHFIIWLVLGSPVWSEYWNAVFVFRGTTWIQSIYLFTALPLGVSWPMQKLEPSPVALWLEMFTGKWQTKVQLNSKCLQKFRRVLAGHSLSGRRLQEGRRGNKVLIIVNSGAIQKYWEYSCIFPWQLLGLRYFLLRCRMVAIPPLPQNLYDIFQ